MHMIQKNTITMLPLTIRMLRILLGMSILSILLGMIILSIVSRQKARRILHARCPGTAWCLASSQRRSATETTLWASGSPRSSCRRSPTRARRPGPRWRGRRKPRGSTPRTRAECSATSVGSRCGSGATFRPASAGATPCVTTVRNVGTYRRNVAAVTNAQRECSLQPEQPPGGAVRRQVVLRAGRLDPGRQDGDAWRPVRSRTAREGLGALPTTRGTPGRRYSRRTCYV